MSSAARQAQSQWFPAPLGAPERLVTNAVAYGVGLGVPGALGVTFAVATGHSWLLLLPAPFLLAVALAQALHPRRFGVRPGVLTIESRVGRREIALDQLSAIDLHPTIPGGTIGLVGSQGYYGSFGLFWNPEWRRFRAYITDATKLLGLEFRDGARVLLSPEDPRSCAVALQAAAPGTVVIRGS
jgi:hypothetical protein